MRHSKRTLKQYAAVFQRGRLRTYAEKHLPQRMRLYVLAGRSLAARRIPNPVPLPVLIPGTPGYRTREGRSGLDYMDSVSEEARMEGVFLRALFTLKLRTRDPFYLGLMAVFGLPMFFAGWVMVFEDLTGNGVLLDMLRWNWFGFLYFIFFILVFLFGISGFLMANLVASLLDLRKKS